MADRKQTFTPEFRAEAVRLAQTSGRSRREIAADLGFGLPRLAGLPRHWPASDRAGGRLRLGMTADFKSESPAGFVGIRTAGHPLPLDATLGPRASRSSSRRASQTA
jgi:hypothetical protein